MRNAEVYSWALLPDLSSTLEFLGLCVVVPVPSCSGSGLKLLIHHVPTTVMLTHDAPPAKGHL